MKVIITIQGLTPLLMNRFTEANEVAVSGGTSVTFKGSKGTPRDQAQSKRYFDNDTGSLFIPGPNLFAAIIAAGVFHKAGKSKLTTQKSSLIPAGLVIDDIVCPLHDEKSRPITEWEVDSRSVVIPSTGGRIMCHRPRIDCWQCTFTVEIDDTMFSPDLIRAIIDDAGKKVGLGDYRPSRKGPFGRFVVVKWSPVKAELSKAA